MCLFLCLDSRMGYDSPGCGALSLELLGFHRFYHVRWQIFYLVGEAVISHLEFSSVVFDVVYLEGTQLANF